MVEETNGRLPLGTTLRVTGLEAMAGLRVLVLRQEVHARLSSVWEASAEASFEPSWWGWNEIKFDTHSGQRPGIERFKLHGPSA